MAVDQDISNITLRIAEKVDRNLHLQRGHPLNTIKSMIEGHFKQVSAANPKYQFECIDNLPPMVTTKQCFDELLTPPDHVSRKLSDTYYIDKKHVLRTHTSAHQTELMRMGKMLFCVQETFIGVTKSTQVITQFSTKWKGSKFLTRQSCLIQAIHHQMNPLSMFSTT